MRTDFAEVRLDLNTKATGGYAFRNSIQRLSNSLQERRICNNPLPMFKGALTRLTLTECELDYFTAFFNARRGKTQGFRYKFWSDYTTTAITKTHVEGYSIGTVMPGVVGQTRFQMVKKYVSGGQETIKPLYKIVSGSVTEVRVGGVSTQSFSVDENTGQISLSPAPSGEVTFTCEFDIPVRFDLDKLPSITELVDPQSDRLCYSFGAIPLVELQVAPTIDPFGLVGLPSFNNLLLYQVRASRTIQFIPFGSTCPGNPVATQVVYFEGQARGVQSIFGVVGCSGLKGGFSATNWNGLTLGINGKAPDGVTDQLYMLPQVGFSPNPPVSGEVTNENNHYTSEFSIISAMVINE